jgi:tRNA G10  N-methylase Trm11
MFQRPMSDTTTKGTKHPAKYTKALIPVMAKYLNGNERVLDPMAGCGGVLELLEYHPNLDVYGVELEQEWVDVAADSRIVQGDARHLSWGDGYFNATMVSPPYANRLSDVISKGKWFGTRISYADSLGRDLTPESAAAMPWGDRYRNMMSEIWIETSRVLCSGGVWILNVKNHIRDGKEQYVTEWHYDTIRSLGYDCIASEKVLTPGMRRGANNKARIDYEYVIVFRKQ